jgi:hypothetical protein
VTPVPAGVDADVELLRRAAQKAIAALPVR